MHWSGVCILWYSCLDHSGFLTIHVSMTTPRIILTFMAKRENLQHVDCINLLALPNLLFLALICAIWILKDAVTNRARTGGYEWNMGLDRSVCAQVEGCFHSWDNPSVNTLEHVISMLGVCLNGWCIVTHFVFCFHYWLTKIWCKEALLSMILFQFVFDLLHRYDVFLGRDLQYVWFMPLQWASKCDFKCDKYSLMLPHVVCKNVQ